MQYDVKLLKSDEGYAVWCPALPGCWSQGKTEQEARRTSAMLSRSTWRMRIGLRARGDSDDRGLIMPRIPGVNHLDAVRRRVYTATVTDTEEWLDA